MLKKMMITLTGLSLMIASSMTYAFGFSAGIIYVDDRLYQDLAANYQQSLEELAEDNDEFSEARALLEADNKVFQEKLADLQANRVTLSEADLESSTQELEALQAKIVALEQSISNLPELAGLQQRYQQSIQLRNAQLVETVAIVAEERGLDVVLPSNSVVYVGDDVEDITDDVIAKLAS